MTATRCAEVSWGEALSSQRRALQAAAPDKVAVLGGARLTNESAYAWAKLAKGVIGTDHVDSQLGDGLPAEVVLGLPRATIDDVCAPGGTVLLLAPDLKEELPVLFLRLRHAVARDGATARGARHPALVALRRWPPPRSSTGPAPPVRWCGPCWLARRRRRSAASSPMPSRRRPRSSPTDPSPSCSAAPTSPSPPTPPSAAAAAIHAAHPEVRFLSALRRGNVHGALDMGLAPGLLPGRTTLADAGAWFTGRGWPKVPSRARPRRHRHPRRRPPPGKVDVLVLLGADPLADFPDTDLAARGVAGARTVIAVDRFLTASAEQADVVLAAAGPDRGRRHHHQPRGPRQRGGAQDHPAGHRPRRLDARRRAGRLPRRRPRARVRRRRSSRRSPPWRRATSA